MRRIYYKPRHPGSEDGKDHIRKEEASLARICPGCGAVSLQKRWFFDEECKNKLLESGRFEYDDCPGCLAAEQEDIGGIVVLSGGFLEGRIDEFVSAVRHEEQSQHADNPANMIVNMAAAPGSIVIRTANPFMAERIGKRIRQAYDGELTIVWSERDRLARVYWSREG